MRPFYKMTGSGNDFVFFDARDDRPPATMTVERVRELCARGTGIGADGVVWLERADDADVAIRYHNSDGSPASLCGNATLCTVRLAAELGLGSPSHLRIRTDAGVVSARLTHDTPEFDVGPIERLCASAGPARAPSERAIGYAVVGVPHLVVLVDHIEAVDVVRRGSALRFDPWCGAAGANVNFVAPAVGKGRAGEWVLRTYERGVEGETLACGTGAVAAAGLLRAWGVAGADPVRFWTRSGLPLDVSVDCSKDAWTASLRGEGRLVFRGELVED